MKIAIVDDHPMVRQGIRLTLSDEPDIEIVGEMGGSREALDFLKKQRVDILILDISLPDGNGFELLREVLRVDPQLAVLIFSIHRESNLAIRALKAGARGFLNKESAPEALVAALRRLAAGRTYTSPYVAELMVRAIGGNSVAEPHTQLSDREYQVMCLLAIGKSVTQIAEHLHRSPNTISTYRTRILLKMSMTSNAELTRYCLENQLIVPF